MTETLIAGAVLALLLIVTALGVAKVRSDLKHQQVRQLLGLLDEALSAYHQAGGHWPMCPPPAGPVSTTRGTPHENEREAADRGFETAKCAMAALSAEPKSREILQKIPAILLATDKSGAAEPVLLGGVRDAWGGALRCLTINSQDNIDRQAVAANGGKPIFISAGADGNFGIKNIVAAADNLRSDELP